MQRREIVHNFLMHREKVAGANLHDELMEVVPEQ